MLSVRAVRSSSLVLCAAGIAGMIVTSILNHNGAAVTFGLITAVAVVCSMVAKAVAADTERKMTQLASSGAGSDLGAADAPASDTMADMVERQVQLLVDAGASEDVVRQLVGEAVRLGRALGPPRPDATAPTGTFASGGAPAGRRDRHAGNV